MEHVTLLFPFLSHLAPMLCACFVLGAVQGIGGLPLGQVDTVPVLACWEERQVMGNAGTCARGWERQGQGPPSS